MSQDEPKSQPPLPPDPDSEQLKTTAKQNYTPQTTSKSFQAVLKTQSIKTLKWTIQALEGLVVKLETSNSAALEQGQTTPSFLDKLQMGWSATLAKIRSFLPENLSALSDTALTGIVAGIAVLVVWTSSALLSGKQPETVPEVAEVPPSEQVPPANIITPPELIAPTAPEKQQDEPTDVTIPPETTPIPSEKEQEPTANIDTPPELTAPAAPEPIAITPSPKLPTPMPTVELTPEQNLIASIQNQVAEISDRFADGLIQSIQANFQNSRLIIKVSNDWYSLQPSQQDNLAVRMLERARTLDFSQLEITDSQGTSLARSPVVGTEMVILKRTNPNNQQQALSS